MKRFFIVLAVLSTMGIHVMNAQEMQRGMSLFNVGLGLIDGYGYHSSWGLNVSYDYGLVDTWGPGIFTIGAYAGFDAWTKRWGIAPRVTYRYAINNSFEVFGTAMLGAYIRIQRKPKDDKIYSLFSSTVGCRYSFTRNLSVFGEIGYGISFLNGGLSFSF